MSEISPKELNESKSKIKISTNQTLAILALILILTLGTILVTQYFGNKRVSEGLQGVYITDLNDRSAIVSWVTSSPVKTELIYSTEELSFFSQFGKSQTGYDRRDLEEVDDSEYRLKKRGKYYTHSVILRDLDPETEYYFAIKNGLFLNSSAYINTFSTTKIRENLETPDVAYGNILNQNGELISDTLLILELTNVDDSNKSQTFSYVMDGNTGWSVDLANLWDSNFEDNYVKDKDTYLNIKILNSKENTSRLVEYGDLKPVENISAYDNEFVIENILEEVQSFIKGVFIKRASANTKFIACEESGGTWDPSVNVCICPANYKLNSYGYCVSTSPTCTRQSGICACNCPSPYSETKPAGDYDTTTLGCPQTDNCGVSCGNPVKKTCYKPKAATCACYCQPKCPSTHPETHNNGKESVPATCTGTDSCGKSCTNTIRCYKAETAVVKVDGKCGGNAKSYESTATNWDSKFCEAAHPIGFNPSTAFPYMGGKVTWKCPGVNGGITVSCEASRLGGTTSSSIDDIPKAKCDGYDIINKQSLHWCECKNGGISMCKGGKDLLNNYGSSCPKYCEASKNAGFVKTKTCGSGELASCPYGCESKGPSENDICKPKPTTVPQEILCSKIHDGQACVQTDGMCTWVSNTCKAVTPSAGITCADLKTFAACNVVYGCEYKDGICKRVGVQVTNPENEEYDTSGYIGLTNSEICTGVQMGNYYAKVTQGTNMEESEVSGSYHVSKSSCAIDLSVPTGTPLWNGQIPGTTFDGSKIVWEEGYSCTSGSGDGFGNYVDIKQPNGVVVRYAHLTTNSCSGFMSGATGNSDPGGHLHVEVRLDAQDPSGCLGETNPCNYIAGGCYECASMASGVGINDDPGAYDVKGLTLVSKAFAKDEWPDASAFVDDKSLQEGLYSVTYGATSKKTQFVKTNDNHIVFFEDDNNNGILDENEKILSPSEAEYKYAVSYSKVADSFKLVMQEGLNLVSFPIIFEDSEEKEIKKVSELLQYLNDGGAKITSIATFRSGKFLVYANRDGQEYGDDYNLLPGEGYFLTSLSEGVFLYSGKKVENSLEIQLYEGWNLINIYNSNKPSYSGFNILEQIQSKSIKATTISKWEDGRYNSIVSNEGSQFGYDFKIYPTRGYFLRVEEGKGKFSPE